MKRLVMISLAWLAGTFLLFSWLTYSTGNNADAAEEMARLSAERAAEHWRSKYLATNVTQLETAVEDWMEASQATWQLSTMGHWTSVTRTRIWIVWLVMVALPIGYLWWPRVSGWARDAVTELRENKPGSRPLVRRLGWVSVAWVLGVTVLTGLFLVFAANRNADRMQRLVEQHGPLSSTEKGTQFADAFNHATTPEERMAAYDNQLAWMTGRWEMMGLEARQVRLRQQAWTVWALAAVLPLIYLWLPFVGALSRQEQALEDQLASSADV